MTEAPIAESSDLAPGPINLQVDWKATWQEFNKLHGGNPVPWRNRLLYVDGWSHAKDYKGPRWPPPIDPQEFVQLTLTYWKRRRQIVEPQRAALLDMLEGMQNLQRALGPVPIMHRMTVKDEESGKTVTKTVQFRYEEFRPRLRWLEQDVAEADKHIAECIEVLRGLAKNPSG